MKRLLILSGKGGTGKTTVASAFINFSKTKAFADCDVDAPNLHILNKVDAEPQKSDFIGGDKAYIDPQKCVGCSLCYEKCNFGAIYKSEDKYKVNEYACEGCGVCTLVCKNSAVSLLKDTAGEKLLYKDSKVFSTARLKMGRGNSGKLVTEVKLSLFKNAPETELAILDGSPGIGCPVISSLSGMDYCLIVSEPSLSGLSDLQRLVKTAEPLGTRLLVCINKFDTSPILSKRIEDFCKEKNITFVGKIPYDKKVSEAVNDGKSIAEFDSPAKEALFELYKNTASIILS